MKHQKYSEKELYKKNCVAKQISSESKKDNLILQCFAYLYHFKVCKIHTTFNSSGLKRQV